MVSSLQVFYPNLRMDVSSFTMVYFPLPSHSLNVIILILFCEKCIFFKLPIIRFLQASSLLHFLLRLLLYEHLVYDGMIVKNRLRFTVVHLFVCVSQVFPLTRGEFSVLSSMNSILLSLIVTHHFVPKARRRADKHTCHVFFFL